MMTKSHHLLQIRPIRADLDVQRFRQAREEKENHSEGERSKEKELKSTEERIKRKPDPFVFCDYLWSNFVLLKVNTREPVFNETLNFEVLIIDDHHNVWMIIILNYIDDHTEP